MLYGGYVGAGRYLEELKPGELRLSEHKDVYACPVVAGQAGAGLVVCDVIQQYSVLLWLHVHKLRHNELNTASVSPVAASTWCTLYMYIDCC